MNATRPAVIGTASPGERLRVLMVCCRFFPSSGGTETHVFEAGRRIAAQGHDVTVLTANPGGLPASEIVEGMQVTRVPAWPRNRDYFFAPTLASHILRGHWNVAHVQGYHTLFAPLAILALVRRRIPFALTFHSGGHSSGLRNALRRLHHWCLAPLATRAARLVGVSQFEADFFSTRMGIPRNRFAVVPNGAKLPVPSRTQVRDPARPLIVSLGRLERYKGHHLAIAGFAELLRSLPGARLRILGEGPFKDSLRQQANDLGLVDEVEIGSIPASDRTGMADLLAGASLVVLLSEYEAHPVAVMEALSLGVPVLTSDTSGFRELAARELVRAIPLASRPGEIAIAMAAELHRLRGTLADLPDWDTCADRLIALYRSVLTQDRSARNGSSPISEASSAGQAS